MNNILLLGTNGQSNLGDDILLDIFLASLSSNSHQTIFFVNSYFPDDTNEKYKNRYCIKTFHTIRDIYKLPFIIIYVKNVVFGGGSIIRELYETTERWKYSSMLMILFVIMFAKMLRRKVYLSNIGIGPIDSNFGKIVTKSILSIVDMVTFRDQNSYNLATDIAPKATNKMKVVPDAVFSLRKSDSVHIENNKQKKIITIGLNLDFDIANPKNWNYFLRQLEKIFFAMHQNMNLKIVGIPMQYGFNKNNDFVVLKKFGNQLTKRGIKFEMSKKLHSANDLFYIYSKLDLILCERFHSSVFAIITQTPLFALGYDVKVKSLMQDVGLQEFCVDINDNFDEKYIISVCTELIKNPKKQIAIMNNAYINLHAQSVKYFKELCDRVHNNHD